MKKLIKLISAIVILSLAMAFHNLAVEVNTLKDVIYGTSESSKELLTTNERIKEVIKAKGLVLMALRASGIVDDTDDLERKIDDLESELDELKIEVKDLEYLSDE